MQGYGKRIEGAREKVPGADGPVGQGQGAGTPGEKEQLHPAGCAS